MSEILFNTMSWPVVQIVVPRDVDFVIGVKALNEQYARLLARRQPFAVIFDLRRLPTMPDAKSRSALGDFLKSHVADFARYVAAEAYVLDGFVARGLVTAVSWAIQKRPYPNRTFGDMDAAVEWARVQLRARSDAEEMELRASA